MSGMLRHQVAIQAATDTADEGGGRARAWTDFALVWARIESENGDEVLLSGALVAQPRVKLTLRYRNDVTAQMRVRWGSSIIALTSVADPDGRGRYLIADGVYRGDLT